MWPSLSLIPFCILARNPRGSPADSYIFLQALHLRSAVRLGGHLQPNPEFSSSHVFQRQWRWRGYKKEIDARLESQRRIQTARSSPRCGHTTEEPTQCQSCTAELSSWGTELPACNRARAHTHSAASCPQKAGGSAVMWSVPGAADFITSDRNYECSARLCSPSID